MDGKTIQGVWWYGSAVAVGFFSGFAAAVLALLISGNTYNLHLPGWTIWLPLPAIPALLLVALNKLVKPVTRTRRWLGGALFVVAAGAGTFLLAVLLAQADHA
jgi:uncharacterized membrane protein YphA (DoxX/SURF4 family)